MKLDVNQFSSIFSVPKWKQFFRLVETDFLSNAIYSDEWNIFFSGVLLLKANFELAETIIRINVNQFLIE